MNGERFTYKRCSVDELLARDALIRDLAGTPLLPELNSVARQYRELEKERRVMCAVLMDGAEAVGFLLARNSGMKQAGTAVIDVAVARPELGKEWFHTLGAMTYTEAKSMAYEMGATGLRIPDAVTGPAALSLKVKPQEVGTAFYEAFK